MINGKEAYQISVFDHGLLYGDGVYETIRIFKGRAFFLNDHIDRLFASAKGIFLNPPYSQKELISLIKSAYRKAKLDDAFLRIIITRGIGAQGLSSKAKPNVIIIFNQRQSRPLEKINLTVSKIRRVSKTAIDSRIKSLNYMNNILARLQAKNKGFDDAILLNESDEVTEATTSNIFMVIKGEIYTPSADSGILEGITRKVICHNFPVKEKVLSVKDLLSADEVFLSGSVNLITSAAKIDKKTFKHFAYANKVYKTLIILSKKGVKLYE